MALSLVACDAHAVNYVLEEDTNWPAVINGGGRVLHNGDTLEIKNNATVTFDFVNDGSMLLGAPYPFVFYVYDQYDGIGDVTVKGGTLKTVGNGHPSGCVFCFFDKTSQVNVADTNLISADFGYGIYSSASAHLSIDNKQTVFSVIKYGIYTNISDNNQSTDIQINSRNFLIDSPYIGIYQSSRLDDSEQSKIQISGDYAAVRGSKWLFYLNGAVETTITSQELEIKDDGTQYSLLKNKAKLNLLPNMLKGEASFLNASGQLNFGKEGGTVDFIGDFQTGDDPAALSRTVIWLDNASFYKGAIGDVNKGETSVFMKKNSSWEMTTDSNLKNLEIQDYSEVNLQESTDKYARLSIDVLNNTNGIFALDVDIAAQKNDSVVIHEKVNGTGYIRIKSSGTGSGEDSGILIFSPVDTADNAFELVPTQSKFGAVVDEGLYLYSLANKNEDDQKQWYLTLYTPPSPDPDPTPDPVLSPTAEAVVAMAGMGAQSALYLNQLSDVRKRLGEIRGTVKDGLWVSAAGQKDRISGFAGTGFKQDAYRFNLGFDRVAGNWILGGNFKYMSANQKTRDTNFRAKGEAHSEGLNLYASWQNNKGCYADFVLSADHYHQRINTNMLDGIAVKGSYHNWGVGVSAEGGRKTEISKDSSWFIEPQVQLSYYRLKGDSFTMSNEMRAHQKNFDSLTGRLGVVAGKDFLKVNGSVKGQLNARAGIKHEFLGNGTLYVNDVKFRDDLVGTRVYYGLGADWTAKKNLKFYGHVERENGSHYTKEIEVLVGMKYSF